VSCRNGLDLTGWQVVYSARSKILQVSVLAGGVVANLAQRGVVLNFLETIPALRVIVLML
jgi:hypothetical protein